MQIDKIDSSVGIVLCRKIGDRVQNNEIVSLYKKLSIDGWKKVMGTKKEKTVYEPYNKNAYEKITGNDLLVLRL